MSFLLHSSEGGICLHLLDQEIFFVPSPEPVYLEQSSVTKQQIYPYSNMGLTIDLDRLIKCADFVFVQLCETAFYVARDSACLCTHS